MVHQMMVKIFPLVHGTSDDGEDMLLEVHLAGSTKFLLRNRINFC